MLVLRPTTSVPPPPSVLLRAIASERPGEVDPSRRQDAGYSSWSEPAAARLLVDAEPPTEVVGSERRGLWAYYYVLPEALDELSAWLS